MKVVVYVEGGGNQRKILDECRRGFGQLFERVVLSGDHPKVIACADRDSTFRDFRNVLHQGREGFLILLVDSEGPVQPRCTSWTHLTSRDGWKRPKRAGDDQAHLMVQCMESWFLADHEALRRYYKKAFRRNSLPGRANIEEILKQDVERALGHAARPTEKLQYHKTRDGFALLAEIDPARVRAASFRAEGLFEVLETRARM